MKKNQNITIVLGVIGADCHAVGNKIIASVLTNLGFDVINLGVMVSQDEFVDAAIKNNASVIFVSSIYGHGEIDCQGLRQRCVIKGIGDILLYVGGNLVIGKKPFNHIESLFMNMGYDRVFAPSTDLRDVVALLESDINSRYRERTLKIA